MSSCISPWVMGQLQTEDRQVRLPYSVTHQEKLNCIIYGQHHQEPKPQNQYRFLLSLLLPFPGRAPDQPG